MLEKEFKEHSDRVIELLKVREERKKELKECTEELLELESSWRNESNDIILNTDFKKLYGKDNEHIRNAHLNTEIPDMTDKIEIQKSMVNFLEMDISQIDKEINVHNKILSFINIVNDNKKV